MRLLVLLLAAAALAGCIGDDNDDVPPADGTTTTPAADVPAAIHHEGSLVGVGDVEGAAGPCVLDDMTCVRYAFSIDDAWSTTLSLTSVNGVATGATQPALYGTDYDLFLYDGSGQQIGSSTNPSGTVDEITRVLPTGDYEVLVQAWHDLDGSYVLDITFEAS